MKQNDKQPKKPNNKPKKEAASKPLPKKLDQKTSYILDLDAPELAIVKDAHQHVERNQKEMQLMATEFANSLKMPYSQLELQQFTAGLDNLAKSIAVIQQSHIAEAIKPLIEANKIYQEQFAQVFRSFAAINEFTSLRLNTVIALQGMIKTNVAVFADFGKIIYDAKLNLFSAFESINKMMPAVKIVSETFAVKLNTLEGHKVVGQRTTVDVAVKTVREHEGQTAVGGNIITYRERGNFVLVKRGDFNLLVASANNNDGIKHGIDDIKQLLGSKEEAKPLEVNARFTKVSAELTLFGKTIRISGDSYQGSLCEILFNSEEAFGAEWHIDDLLTTDEFGMQEVPDEERSHWVDRVYQWARQLNMKIASMTGKQDFIMVRDQKIFINPRYIS